MTLTDFEWIRINLDMLAKPVIYLQVHVPTAFNRIILMQSIHPLIMITNIGRMDITYNLSNFISW